MRRFVVLATLDTKAPEACFVADLIRSRGHGVCILDVGVMEQRMLCPDVDKTEVVEAAGRRIVAMVDEDLKPRDIMTEAAFANAAKVTLAVSGSINAVKHLAAIAQERVASMSTCTGCSSVTPTRRCR